MKKNAWRMFIIQENVDMKIQIHVNPRSLVPLRSLFFIIFYILGFFYFSSFVTITFMDYGINTYAQDGNRLMDNSTINNNINISQSSWTTGAPMPTPRSEIAGAALNGKIYIIGGFDGTGQATTSVEVYDPIADKWTNAASLPQPLDHTAAASYGDKLYVVGGGYLSRDSLSNKLFIYDPLANEWTEGANLPSARGALTANFINGTLYAVGGVDASETTLTSNWAYDPRTNTWSEKAPMPTAREHLTSATV